METIGIIMDGNRRWAKAHGLPSLAGHQAGYEVMKNALRWAKAAGVKTVYLYAFSTENWNRSAEEVNHLMGLFRRVLKADAAFFREEGVRLSFIGDRARLAEDIQKGMAIIETETRNNTDLHAVIAVSYGGRAEIVAAVNRLMQSRPPLAPAVTEASFTDALWTAGFPDPELIIRTGGAKRLSNFLPWQSTYADIAFLEPFWPDFTEDLFRETLAAFRPEDRRHGK